KGIVAEPEVGEIYKGKVKSVVEFGAFVEILPGKEGLLHVSEMDWKRIEDPHDFIQEGEEIEVKCDPNAPFAALVFKTTADPYVGKLSFMRLFSGKFAGDAVVLNANKEKDEKVAGLMIVRGKNQENIGEVVCGDIVTVAKLADTTTGETLCSKEKPVKFESPAYPPALMSMAIFPKSKGDEDKLGTGLAKITDEDPTYNVRRDVETKETILSGMGELHLEIAKEKLKRKFGVEVEFALPRIPYKETIKKSAHVDSKYKKQSGGKGQYGHCVIDIAPIERGKQFEFIDKVVGGAIPKNFIPSIEKGIRKTMEDGAVAGYPIVDLSITVVDGSYHAVDSSDMAFQIAGSMGLKKGMADACPCLLEPINNVEVIVPDQYMGDVIGDINSKRGRIMGMDPMGKGLQNVKAQVPLAEMQRYAIDLRSMTQGRGVYTMEFDHYEEVPSQIAEVIIEAYKKEKEA
ncbi:MAG: elongation factor G, partial [bacterium]|nr:elongation factor G [bacterium]